MERQRGKVGRLLLFFLEWDNAPAWEYPDQSKALEEKVIPSICFEMQKYQLSATDKKQIKTSLGRFVENKI